MSDTNAFSFAASTIGLVLPFVLTDPPSAAGTLGVPVSNALAMGVTWITLDGRMRPLRLSAATSAVFTYVVSAGDSQTAHFEEGYLQISIGTTTVFTSTFTMRIVPHF